MIIIGVDFHPEFQQIAFVDTDTGELEERRLHHPDEAEGFYRALLSQGKTVRVGMEARDEERREPRRPSHIVQCQRCGSGDIQIR
jgi:hypothetical protein